jgi:signal transduction histidine kinase
LEKQFFRRDGSLIWGRLSISILGTGTSRRVVAMVEDLSEKKAAEEKLLQSEASLRTFGSRLIQAQEEERLRIARELHDDILQQVILVSVGLDHLHHNLPNSKDEVAKKISEARERLSDISTDIHELSHRLHSAKLEYLGLVAAAASFCRDLSARQKVGIDFKSEGIPPDLPEVASLSLYRVLQEALQNAIKHSGSQRIEVSLMRVSNEIHLNVRDWGKGFDPSTVRAGLGLVSMQERLILVNGGFSVQSTPEQGTTIDVRVPLQTGRTFHAASPKL